MKAKLLNDEAERLQELQQYQILDTETEAEFDDITQLARQICQTSMAFLNFIDESRQWFKSKIGIELTQMPVDIGLCPICIEQKDILIFNDTLNDPRSRVTSIATSYPYIRFYAGVPLITAQGNAIGTLVVADHLPREITPEQVEALRALGRQVMSQLELRRNLARLQEITYKFNQVEENRILIQQAVESASDAICMAETSGKAIYHNQALINLYEYSVDELNQIGGLKAIFVQPEMAEQLFNDTINCQFWNGEVELKTKSGLIIPTWVRANCVLDEVGKSIGLISVCTNITERKQAEQALQARIRQQACVAELSQQAITVTDLDQIMEQAALIVTQCLDAEFSNILELLPSGKALLLRAGVGWQPGLVGHATLDIYTGSQAGYTLLSSEPVISEDLLTETRFSCSPLIEQHGIVSGMSVLISCQNQTFGVLCVHTTQKRTFTKDDIHFLQSIANVLAMAIERQQAEDTIRAQADLLDVSTDAILVRDLESQILFWNKGAERLYGWSVKEALGKNTYQILFNGISPQLRDALKTLTEKDEWQGELEQVTKDGKEIIVYSRWTLIRDKLGKPKSILLVNTNITDKKRLEEQFLRTQRLESIGTLAGGIAHDLNNLLAPILMSIQLLEKKLTDQQSRRLLSTLEINAKRGADLIKQVLSFARGIESKRTIIQVRHLISEIKHIAKETFPKSIEFTTNIPRDLWTLCGDATQIHQVLMNLCVNARDAMENGGKLNISAKNILFDENYVQMNSSAKVGSYIVITVSDTGSGIPQDIIDKIFEPFFTTKEIGKGTGLGLSTVSDIVKSHGGFIKVYSELAQGTQFQLYFPAIDATERQPLEDIEMPIGTGELILVVDDEAAIREITKNVLETYGYRVITANDGIEAVAIYVQNQNDINVVLTNMMMPSMDGATTILTLRKINPDVKIIVVSGIVSNDKLPEGVNQGVKSFLSKPYTAKELLKTMNAVLVGN